METTVIHTTSAPEPIGPYSQAVKTGGTLYVSGQIALDPISGELMNASLAIETQQVFANLRAIIEAAGFKVNQIVKTSIFLKDMGDFAEINQLYADFVSPPYPARETVEVSRLPKDVRVEISVIAVQ